MSDEEVKVNDNLVLIGGKASSGKSGSLMNLKNPEGVLYLNCENGKKLPFKSKFNEVTITDPMDVLDILTEVEDEDNDHIHTVVIDTLTYLMNMYESQYVLTSANTQKAWGDYAQFGRQLFSKYVANSTKNIIILAHTSDVFSDQGIPLETLVKVKGSLMDVGIESFFSCVVSAKKVPLRGLKNYENELLNVTEEDKILGYKHVLQTRLTKDTATERMRSGMGMWDINESFIDCDAQLVLDRLNEFYE